MQILSQVPDEYEAKSGVQSPCAQKKVVAFNGEVLVFNKRTLGNGVTQEAGHDSVLRARFTERKGREDILVLYYEYTSPVRHVITHQLWSQSPVPALLPKVGSLRLLE
jgi:hypothetical protein